jgi:hypothetical protein
LSGRAIKLPVVVLVAGASEIAPATTARNVPSKMPLIVIALISPTRSDDYES